MGKLEFLEKEQFSGAAFHNSIFRGKFLGNSVTDQQYNKIADGSFDDLFIGDYWTIESFDRSINYRIAALDYYYGKGYGADNRTTSHHVLLVPDVPLYSYTMNGSNDTTNTGFSNSKMFTESLKSLENTLNGSNIFNNHLMEFGTTIPQACNNGNPTSYIHVMCKSSLLSQRMIFGSEIMKPVASTTWIKNYTRESTQLPLFLFAPWLIYVTSITPGNNPAPMYFLQDSVSSTAYAAVNYTSSNLSDQSAKNSLGTRPYFCIYGGNNEQVE